MIFLAVAVAVAVAVVSAVVIGCAIALVTVMHLLHAKPTRADIARVTDPDPGTAHSRNVGVRIVGVDLEKEKLALRLECGPSGDDLCAGFSFPQSLKYPMYVDVGISDTGTQQTKVFSGTSDGGLVDADLDPDGKVEDHPSDRNVAVLWIAAYRVLPGRFTVTRPPVTTTAVYLSVVLTWILIVSVIGMVVSVLFAVKAFRNALPGAPPLGTTSDHVSLFWEYVVAIVASGVVAADSPWHRGKHEQQENAGGGLHLRRSRFDGRGDTG